MLKKKYIIVLLLLIVGIFAISSVSANDNVTDVAAADEASDDLVNNVEEDVSTATVDEDESNLSLENSNNVDVLSGSPYAEEYDVEVYDATIYGSRGGTIDIDVYPSEDDYDYLYDFYLRVYKRYTYNGGTSYTFYDKIFEKNLYESGSDRDPFTLEYTFSPGQFAPGTYYVALINYEDGYLLDMATLSVIEDAIFYTSGNYNQFYNSGVGISVRAVDKTTGAALKGVPIKVTFSNGVTVQYTTDANGFISFIPPVGVGTYSVLFAPANGNVQASPVSISAVIKKSTVQMKAYKAVTYKGFKLCLKVTVKSQGRNVNEGVVKFKIKGKTYTAAVVNGVAVKYIKLGKIKKYKYTATFIGKNFYTKKVKGKAEVRKRYKTKIIGKKSIKGNMYKNKKITFKIRTKSGGKKVKGGYLLVYDKTHGYLYWHKVKGGKASHTFTFNGNLNYYGYYSGVYQYSKKAVTKYKIYYVPSTLKYKGSHIKFKKVSKYKCSTCGKKKSHTHGGGWFTTYIYVT